VADVPAVLVARPRVARARGVVARVGLHYAMRFVLEATVVTAFVREDDAKQLPCAAVAVAHSVANAPKPLPVDPNVAGVEVAACDWVCA
jgi:hypothetical protein